MLNNNCMCIVQIPLGFGTVIHFLVWYVFREEHILMKDVWRSTVMDSGGQYVVMDLTVLMLPPSVDNLDMTHTCIITI